MMFSLCFVRLEQSLVCCKMLPPNIPAGETPGQVAAKETHFGNVPDSAFVNWNRSGMSGHNSIKLGK